MNGEAGFRKGKCEDLSVLAIIATGLNLTLVVQPNIGQDVSGDSEVQAAAMRLDFFFN